MDDVRRALIKFDTQNTIPTKSTIQSAVGTLTLKAAGADALRAITVLPVTTSFVQEEAMWNRSRTFCGPPRRSASSATTTCS